MAQYVLVNTFLYTYIHALTHAHNTHIQINELYIYIYKVHKYEQLQCG